MLPLRKPYSYREDSSVPDFDDRGPVVFMDGQCALCSAGARLIDRFDSKKEIRICPVQTETGRAVLTHYGMDPEDPESWLLLADGQAYGSIDAMLRVGRRVGGLGRAVGILSIMPEWLQDRVYRFIARNRYRIFGKSDLCAAPSLSMRDRLMS